jgi:uncharacterized protein YecT (DUF1311 family)
MRSFQICLTVAVVSLSSSMSGALEPPLLETAAGCATSPSKSEEVGCLESAFQQSSSELLRQIGEAHSRFVDRAQVQDRDVRQALLLSATEFQRTSLEWLRNSDETCKAMVVTVDDDSAVSLLRCMLSITQGKLQEVRALPLLPIPTSEGVRPVVRLPTQDGAR